MKFYSLALGASLCLIAHGWEVSIYKSFGCSPPTSTDTYRIFTGDGAVSCQEVSKPPASGIQCAEYQNGGDIGPLQCTDTSGEDGGEGAFWLSGIGRLDGQTLYYYSGTCDARLAIGRQDASEDPTCFNPQGESNINSFSIVV